MGMKKRLRAPLLISWLCVLALTTAVLPAGGTATAQGPVVGRGFSKIDPALRGKLARTPQDRPVDVVLWIEELTRPLPQSPSPRKMRLSDRAGRADARRETAAFLDRAAATAEASAAAATAPVATRLSRRGHPAQADAAAPVIYTRLTPANIARVASWPEVEEIYLAVRAVPKMNIAYRAVGANHVQAYGLNGAGVQLAQVETGGGVATDNPHFQNYALMVDQNATLCLSGHSTGVAGIGFWVAPGSTLLATGSCSGGSSALLDRSAAAVGWGAAAVNHSWGEDPENCRLDFTDRYLDRLVFFYGIAQVVAAGNSGLGVGGNGCVDSPGSGYNTFSVGNYNDRNTVRWGDDVMNGSSSFRDPNSARGDRQAPHVAAPGTNIRSMLTSDPWLGSIGSGTSFAAPIVNAATGLLVHRNPSLKAWPEATKAIIMASAVHNLEGSRRLSERDGAGGIWIPYADAVASGTSGGWWAYRYDCGSSRRFTAARMRLTRGKRVRVVIVWPTDPRYRHYQARPSADLDLRVVNRRGRVVASSLSYDNTYEIVDFKPRRSGTYRAQVVKARCNLDPARLAVAWWRQ
jgi:hypothetical protein